MPHSYVPGGIEVVLLYARCTTAGMYYFEVCAYAATTYKTALNGRTFLPREMDRWTDGQIGRWTDRQRWTDRNIT